MDGNLQRLIAENEVRARAVNEAIERGQWPGERDVHSAFRCECAQAECNLLIELTPREYEDVRSDPRRFIVVRGHERAELETVVRAEPRYLVVQKRDEAGDLAEETDPRG